jgi:hypothetical protein
MELLEWLNQIGLCEHRLCATILFLDSGGQYEEQNSVPCRFTSAA